MNEQKLEHMRRHLGKAEVRRDILDAMLQWRSDIQVTIGRTASLLHLSENQLRDWEDHGLLHPARLANHRQYSLEDLDKLVIIRALINARFAPGDIPSNIDEIANIEELRASLISTSPQSLQNIEDGFSIDQRIEHTKDEIFWRFFTTHILRISLMLIGEFLQNTVIGILLPFNILDASALKVENLPDLGPSLIGWLSRDNSVHVLLTAHPSFQYPTDYCLYPLTTMKNEELLEEPEGDTLIILERQDKRSRLSLSKPTVKLIRRLLAPLYEEKQKIHECFGPGMKDERVSAMKLNVATDDQDILLKGIANIVVRWGGYMANERKRWRFCTISLPDSSGGVTLPLRQQSLIMCAQSDDSPYIVDKSTLSPLKSKTSLSIRAYQSGCVIYRPELSMIERTSTIEESIRSNIAIPVGGEQGQPVAVLYVASDELAAFPEKDQQLLRVVSRLIEDVLNTYRAHKRETENFKDLMRRPEVVDTLLLDVLSENDFMRDMEILLTAINRDVIDEKVGWARMPHGVLDSDNLPDGDEVLSFIALDLDDQQSLASRYGDQIMRLLSETIGLRIQDLIISLMTQSANCRLYYLHGGRFYLILRGISLEKAREKAEVLRRNLGGNISLKVSERSNSLLIVPGITVHLGVTSYKHAKLKELLQRYASIANVCARIYQDLDTVLKMGMDEGGDVIMTWDQKAWGGFMRWTSFDK